MVDVPWGAYPWGTMPWGGYEGSNGMLRWTDLDGNEGGYVFEKNPDFGRSDGALETDDLQRSLNGTLHGYAGALKKKCNLTFTRAKRAQYQTMFDIWALHVPLYYYEQAADTKEKFIGYMMKPPEARSEAAWDDEGNWTQTFSVELEEI